MGDLDVAQVQLLIAGGENLTVEFKSESTAPLNDRDLIEAVVCLANGSGGVLLIGVEDDGAITGARPRHAAGLTDRLRLQALIANRTQPPLTTDISVVMIDNRQVVAVKIPDSPTLVGTTSGMYVRRAIASDGRPTCLPVFTHDFVVREIDRGVLDYATVPLRATDWEDLNPLEFERLRQLVGETAGRSDQILRELSDQEIARALGVSRDGEPVTVGAMLLFGRADAVRRLVPTHEVAFQVLRGTDVEVNDFFSAPLLQVTEELMSRFRARNREDELQLGLFRVGVPQYSEVAFREALANALIHRDYTRLGAVHVRWSEEQIEISSPGGFPEGIRLDNFLVAAPQPRSRVLADAFKRVGIVERTGRGIRRMFVEQLRLGRSAPDYGRTTEANVVAILPGGPSNLGFARWAIEQERQQVPPSLAELQILALLLEERRASTAEIAATVQLTDAEARRQLMRLVEQGMVEARGDGKGRTWHLPPAAYRALGAAGSYVRVRGFDSLQQEQMILGYVDAHGSVTRAEVAELCAVPPDRAGRILRQLVDAGRLVRHGDRRTSRYARPES